MCIASAARSLGRLGFVLGGLVLDLTAAQAVTAREKYAPKAQASSGDVDKSKKIASEGEKFHRIQKKMC